MLTGGILAWRSETSRSIVKNEDLLEMVKLMELGVAREKLYPIRFTGDKQEERYQASIAVFDEKGTFLGDSEKKSTDKKLWLSKRNAMRLRHQIERDYEQATGYNMATENLYISDVGLVFGGTTMQTIHNDDHTEEVPEDFNQRNHIVPESGTILYGLKDEPENRCRIRFAKDNQVDKMELVKVYSGMAVFYAGWVYHAGVSHGGRNASTRMYVDLSEKPE